MEFLNNDTPKFKPTTEILQYRGYTIYMENYKYWIGLNPFQKYLTLSQAKEEIDKIEKMFEENIQKLPTIYNSRE